MSPDEIGTIVAEESYYVGGIQEQSDTDSSTCAASTGVRHRLAEFKPNSAYLHRQNECRGA
jgi:hypothetical protein